MLTLGGSAYIAHMDNLEMGIYIQELEMVDLIGLDL